MRNLDISNGEGVGISLFVQGCPFRCKNCFNPTTWDFDGGHQWTTDTEKRFFELAERPYIKRISLLGGEPLADENLSDVLNLVNKISLLLPNKTIWLYTGFTWEQCLANPIRREIVSKCHVVVDGRYIDELRDVTLKWCGSLNQRVINAQESLRSNKIILYDT